MIPWGAQYVPEHWAPAGLGVTCPCMAGVGAASHTRLLSGAPGARAPSHTRRRPRSPCWAPAVGKALTSGDLGENLSVQRDEPLNPEELGRSQYRGAEWPGQRGGCWDWTARLGPLGRLDAAHSARRMGAVAPGWRRQETRRPSRPFGLLLPGAAGGHRAPVPSQMTAVNPRELRQAAQGTGRGTEAPAVVFSSPGQETPVGAAGAGVWAQVHRPVHMHHPDPRPTIPAPPRTPLACHAAALEVKGGHHLFLARPCPPLTARICVQLPRTGWRV